MHSPGVKGWIGCKMFVRARGLEEPKTPKPCKLLQTVGFQHSAGSSGGGLVFFAWLGSP